MFYNTGIATYIWVLSNRKARNIAGAKFSSLMQPDGPGHCARTWAIRTVSSQTRTSGESATRSLTFEETEESKIFSNKTFGYWKVTVERPLRIEGIDPERVYTAKEIKVLKGEGKRSEAAAPVIKKVHKNSIDPDPLRGLFPATISGNPAIVEYEPDSDLRDAEQVPLLHKGGVEAFLLREVLPYAPDAWYVPSSAKVGYEISFTRHFYKPQPLRSLNEIRADILALERETEGLLTEIVR